MALLEHDFLDHGAVFLMHETSDQLHLVCDDVLETIQLLLDQLLFVIGHIVKSQLIQKIIKQI